MCLFLDAPEAEAPQLTTADLAGLRSRSQLDCYHLGALVRSLERETQHPAVEDLRDDGNAVGVALLTFEFEAHGWITAMCVDTLLPSIAPVAGTDLENVVSGALDHA